MEMPLGPGKYYKTKGIQCNWGTVVHHPKKTAMPRAGLRPAVARLSVSFRETLEIISFLKLNTMLLKQYKSVDH